jgi:hypothetical protein
MHPIPFDPAATEVRLPAPAKINLFLHIVGRRPDGYHLLQTAFRLLDWGDEIQLSLRSDGRILRTTDVPGVPPEIRSGGACRPCPAGRPRVRRRGPKSAYASVSPWGAGWVAEARMPPPY